MHDPGHLFLRRASRVALLVPLMFWLTQYALGWSNAVLPACFSVFTILGFADFGGPTWDRLRANLCLGGAGIVLVALGTCLSRSLWPAVLVTLGVVFAIAYSGVLRGYFGAAVSAAIVPWVYAVCTPGEFDTIPQRCAGWAMGTIVATLAAWLLWPSHPRSKLRLSLADACDRAADALAALVGSHPNSSADGGVVDSSLAALQAAVESMRAVYAGRLVRPGGATARDRSMMLAVDTLTRLGPLLRAWAQTPTVELRPQDEQLAADAIAVLRQCSESLRSDRPIVDPSPLNQKRENHQEDLIAWAQREIEQDRAHAAVDGIGAAFQVRVATMTVQMLAFYVRGAVNARSIKRGAVTNRVTLGDKTILALGGSGTVRQRVASQLSVRSPWFQLAARTSIAIGLTVLIVFLTGVEHGFWVSLGALVALKFDSAGTGRTALQVFAGTLVGFVIGTALILAAGDHVSVLWVLLPVVVFLAAFTPGAVSLSVGQAFFTIFLITLFGITAPAALDTSLVRLEDVLIGLVVSLVVSALIWPHGITPTVYRRLRESAAAAGAYFVAAFDRLIDGPSAQPQVDAAKAWANRRIAQAEETFDLAYSQSGPGMDQYELWTSVANCDVQLRYGADVLTALAEASPLSERMVMSGDALLAAAHRIQSRILRAIAVIGGESDLSDVSDIATATRMEHRMLQRVRTVVREELQTLAERDGAAGLGREAVTLAFAVGWLTQAAWLADRITQRVQVSVTGRAQSETELVGLGA